MCHPFVFTELNQQTQSLCPLVYVNIRNFVTAFCCLQVQHHSWSKTTTNKFLINFLKAKCVQADPCSSLYYCNCRQKLLYDMIALYEISHCQLLEALLSHFWYLLPFYCSMWTYWGEQEHPTVPSSGSRGEGWPNNLFLSIQRSTLKCKKRLWERNGRSSVLAVSVPQMVKSNHWTCRKRRSGYFLPALFPVTLFGGIPFVSSLSGGSHFPVALET